MMAIRKRAVVVCLGILCAAGLTVLLRPSVLYPVLPEGKVREFVHDDEHLKARIRYPEFGRRGVDAAVVSFRDDLFATMHDDSEDHADGGRDTLDVAYRVIWRNWRYASIVYDVTVSSAGLASVEAPAVFSYSVAQTYDLYRNRGMTLADLGPGDVGTIAVALIREDLRGAEGIDADRMTRYLHAGSLGNFLLDGDDVVFYLSAGQVAPPERGAVEVRIPRAAFR